MMLSIFLILFTALAIHRSLGMIRIILKIFHE